MSPPNGEIDDATLAELKAKHGDVYLGEIGELTIATRTMTRQEFRRFMSDALDDSKRVDALDTIARACVVFPAPVEFSKVLEGKPGYSAQIAEKILKIAGVGQALDLKKA